MKLKKDFILRQVGENYIVVPVGAQTVDFRFIITLNETGAFLWKIFTEEKTVDELSAALLDEYDVTPEQAKADVEAFVDKLREADLLE